MRFFSACIWTTRGAGSLVLCRERSVPGRRGHMWGYRCTVPCGFEAAAGVRGLYNCIRSIVLNNPLTSIGNNSSAREFTQLNSPDSLLHCSPGAIELACMQQTHCGIVLCMRFFHIFGLTRGVGSLVYVRVGSGRFLAGEDIWLPITSSGC